MKNVFQSNVFAPLVENEVAKSMQIIEVGVEDELFYLFENVYTVLYPLAGKEQPIVKEYLSRCFVALLDDKPMGRIAVYENPHLEYEGKKAVCLGYYECACEADLCKELLAYVLEEVKDMGYECVIGPMNGSTWSQYRFTTNKGENFFLEPQNSSCYPKHFEQTGFEPIAQYYSSIGKTFSVDAEQLATRQKTFEDKGVSFRNINPMDYENELKKLHEFSLKSFAKNFLFTPISWETFRDKYLPLKAFIDSEFVLFAENKKGELVGLVFGIHDVLCQTEQRIITKTIARDPNIIYTGLGECMALSFVQRAKEAGYDSIVHALIIEDGLSQAVSQKCFGEKFKAYCLYGVLV